MSGADCPFVPLIRSCFTAFSAATLCLALPFLLLNLDDQGVKLSGPMANEVVTLR